MTDKEFKRLVLRGLWAILRTVDKKHGCFETLTQLESAYKKLEKKPAKKKAKKTAASKG